MQPSVGVRLASSHHVQVQPSGIVTDRAPSVFALSQPGAARYFRSSAIDHLGRSAVEFGEQFVGDVFEVVAQGVA